MAAAVWWDCTGLHCPLLAKLNVSLRYKIANNARFVASDFRCWLAVVFCVWISLIVLPEIRRINEIVTLRNDVQSIAKVIERVVLPRHLTKNQQSAISSFLSQFEPHEFAFKLAPRSEEVGSYRVDFQQAFTKGGWRLSETNPLTYADNVQEGLSIQLIQTHEQAKKRENPRNPNPSVLLQQALGLAGVRLNGSGTGGDANVTQELIIISIGLPRKDSYVLTLPEDQGS